ncbi:ABC transporter permease [Pedobacter sp. UBA4863]|uniref:ABC transporter permease n=1 Tax=Pedobacter sp. UBA4863 TaxID=1947060 RepID=UPI0025E6DE07|nr:ABC transporter permease [Pedobacter sp. UBA4863]
MNLFKLSWNNIWAKPLNAALNLLLIAFGTAILTVLLLASTQIENKLDKNSKDIDLVVGAKGSPLQLILSSIYYIDFPTGNIPMKEAKKLMKSPFVKRAVPLAMGDNYNGVRIVGTDSNYISLYGLKLQSGQFWKADLEATIGANVAATQNLKIGDKFHGGHGLTEMKDQHDDHTYTVVGILAPQQNVTDNLILTGIGSIWKMHGDEGESNEHHDHEGAADHTHDDDREFTSLLIQYRSPMAVAMFPMMVNQTTNMQAASPAQESTRLFSLIGVGVDTLQWFALLIMFIAAISVFINLYNSLKERSYDLAIMRTLGASKGKLFSLIILEGLILTIIGTLIGIALGHGVLHLIGNYQESSQAKMTGLLFIKEEIYLLIAGLAIGMVAAIIPAVQAYRSNLSNILAKN